MNETTQQFHEHRENCNRLTEEVYGRGGINNRLELLSYQVEGLTKDIGKVTYELYGNGNVGLKDKVGSLVTIEKKLVQLHYILWMIIIGFGLKLLHTWIQ